jgi:Spherulation-specific family 4
MTVSSRPALVVPAYFGPWAIAAWEALIELAPSVVIVNPANGPGETGHEGYRELVGRLADRGSEVLGYVSTSWMTRDHADIATDVARYREFYGVEGAFFDEIPNAPAEGRTAALRRLGAILGPSRTVCNCGQPIPPRWFDALPGVRWGTFEGGPGALKASRFTGPPDRQIHLVHSVTDADADAVHATLAERGVAFGCVTSDEFPNPWDVLPDR